MVGSVGQFFKNRVKIGSDGKNRVKVGRKFETIRVRIRLIICRD